MHLRQKKKAVLWVGGVMCFIAGMLLLKKTYKYIIMRRHAAHLAPGEYLFSLGEANIEDFLQLDKPDVGSAKLTDTSNPNITVGRRLPDTRPSWCSDGSQLITLPRTSVIVVLQDEHRQVIIQTIYSILLRTPPELLGEVIVVDDGREDDTVGKFLSKIPKLLVARNQVQEGMIHSLNMASGLAKFPVLAFVNAKCEVNVNWLQPMLRRLVQNPNAVVSPVLDKITSHTGEYSGTNHHVRGGFDWSLTSQWEGLDSSLTTSTVISSPIYRGHVFSIMRDRFIQLGKFDKAMELSGAENLELSLKSWLCGGAVEIVPCSRVGQVDLDSELLGIARGKENVYMRNAKRVAEVWLDDYKRFYYYTKPTARMLSAGSVQERKSLRSHLKCKNFKWYLDNVYTQLRLPATDEVMYGNIRQQELCVDIDIGHVPAIAKLGVCNSDRGTQDWSWKKKGEITNGGMCLAADPVETHGYVMVHFCTKDNTQRWQYLNGQIYRDGTNQCLDSHKASVGLVISDCDELYESQHWKVASKGTVIRSKDEV